MRLTLSILILFIACIALCAGAVGTFIGLTCLSVGLAATLIRNETTK